MAVGLPAERVMSSGSSSTLLVHLSPFPLSGEQFDFSMIEYTELFVYWPPPVKTQTQPWLFSGSALFLSLPGDHYFLFSSVYKIKLPILLHPSSALRDYAFLFLSPDCALMYLKFCKSFSFSFFFFFAFGMRLINFYGQSEKQFSAL